MRTGILVLASTLTTSFMGSSPLAVEGVPESVVRDLAAPYFGEREAALEQFRAWLRSQGDQEIAWLRDLLDHRRTEVRAAAAAVLSQNSVPGMGSRLLERIQEETEAPVLQLLAASLALASDVEPLMIEALSKEEALRGQSYWIERILEERVRRTLEGLLREGSIPGFYDGQFASVWRQSSNADLRLIAIANNPDHHVTLRILAIMALHEIRRRTMQSDLQALLLPEGVELDCKIKEDLHPKVSSDDIHRYRIADLSRYTRFSLAKAGATEPMRRLIAEMDRFLSRSRNQLLIESLDNETQPYADMLRGLFFETGYFFQQFDDYVHAAERYLKIIERFPGSAVCQNAHYNLGCIYAIQGKVDRSLYHLRRAVERGFSDHHWLQEDGDLQVLRPMKEFQQIVELARDGVTQESDSGSWVEVITPRLPPGTGFFTLDLASQEKVLRGVLPELTDDDLGDFLNAAPQEQRASLRSLLERLGRPVTGGAP